MKSGGINGWKVLFVVGALAGVAVAVLAALFLMPTVGGGGGLDYYDGIAALFTNELGSFSYTFSVETAEAGTIGTQNADESTDGGLTFTDWGEYAEVKGGAWRYPVYRVQVDGVTMSLEPLMAQFTVSLATDRYNSLFTEVVVRDGEYYINVEAIYDWLANSGDSYLIEVGKTLQKGSKWLTVKEEDFFFPSRYSEDGEKLGYDGVVSMYRQFLSELVLVRDVVKSSVGDEGMSYGDGVTNCSIESVEFFKAFKGIITKSGDWFDRLGRDVAEKDNYIAARQNLALKLQTLELPELSLAGQVRQYTNGKGNAQLEGAMSVRFTFDGTDYLIGLKGTRSGDRSDVLVPVGSQSGSGMEACVSALSDIAEYFSFSGIDWDCRLNITRDSVQMEVVDRFIELVNSKGEEWVSRTNVWEYIEANKYEDKLVQEYADLLGVDLTPPGDEKSVEKPDVEQYPDIIWEEEDVCYSGVYLDGESSSRLKVWRIEYVNKSDSDKDIDCTEFSLRSLLSSVYPANNYTILHDYDNTYEEDMLSTEMTLNACSYGVIKLYFVVGDDGGHMDLFYGDGKIDTAIQY